MSLLDQGRHTVTPILGLIVLAFALAFGLVYGAIKAITDEEWPSW